MHIHKVLENLQRIDALIRRRATGSPEELSQKLGISRATWFRWLEQLTQTVGLPIKYDEEQRTYYYERRGKLIVQFVEDNHAETEKETVSKRKINTESLLPFLVGSCEEVGGILLQIV